MLKPEQVLAMRPVMEAAMSHMLETDDIEKDLAAAIAAAINAWPGVRPVSEVFTAGGDFYSPHIILPLPTEGA